MSAPTTTTSLDLPRPDGGRERHELRAPGAWTRPSAPLTARTAYAAAHVVPVMTADNSPGVPATVDWDSTLAFRRMLWSYGLGVAEAMDTAQRGMGMDWAAAAELIRRSSAEAQAVGGLIACGAGTDHLDAATLTELPGRDPAVALETVLEAYRTQLAVVDDAGSTAILMASRALAATARDAEDYLSVYSTLLAESTGPVILHWLGDAFDPALTGYWGSTDPRVAGEAVLELIRSNPAKVDGIKMSLLDADLEVWVRSQLPDGVRMYTGDDFNYAGLIAGDERGHSDALLGIFAAIAPAASTALQAIEDGDVARGREILAATEPLGRHIFAAPTYYYKTGIAFLAWLNGHQPGFQMVGGLHSGRSAMHLVELFRLADGAGLLLDPELAARRMGAYLDVAGLGAER